jgi:23S rRNA-/tRNA-specific pseudouridylate synthase
LEIIETHIVPAIPEKVRLQEYAHLVFKALPTRSAVKKAIKRKEIRINNQITATGDWIEEGQEITLLKQETKPKKVFKLELEVVWEDEYLAVVNKPEGIPTSGNYFRTVENALPYNITPSTLIDALPYPLPVHRLDNPTSGLLIIAKTRTTQTILSRDLELKKIRKVYLALVQGHTPDDIIYSDALDGKQARTEIQASPAP